MNRLNPRNTRTWLTLAICAALAACGDGDEITAASGGGSPQAGTPAPAPAPAPPAASWVECAKEHQTCQFDGTRKVRYGTESSNVVSTRSASLLCNNLTFGNDPAKGVLKTCWYERETTAQTPAPAPAQPT